MVVTGLLSKVSKERPSERLVHLECEKSPIRRLHRSIHHTAEVQETKSSLSEDALKDVIHTAFIKLGDL